MVKSYFCLWPQIFRWCFQICFPVLILSTKHNVRRELTLQENQRSIPYGRILQLLGKGRRHCVCVRVISGLDGNEMLPSKVLGIKKLEQIPNKTNIEDCMLNAMK